MLFPASALVLDYTLEQLPGEGYLGELQGRKEEHSDTTRSGVPGLVFGNEMFSVLAVDYNLFEMWVGNGL